MDPSRRPADRAAAALLRAARSGATGLRFSPEGDGESSGYEQTDDADPHGNDRTADEDFGPKGEAKQVCDGNQGEDEHG
jgi:hypothetical protein